MFTWLEGKKTYIVAAGMIVAVVVQWLSGDLSLGEAVMQALQGAGLATLRAGIAKV